MSSMKEKMHTGEIYLPDDEEIMSEQLKRLNKLYDFNMTRPTERTLFEPGEGIVIEVYEEEFVVRVRNFITGEWKEDLVYTYGF